MNKSFHSPQSGTLDAQNGMMPTWSFPTPTSDWKALVEYFYGLRFLLFFAITIYIHTSLGQSG